MPKTAVDADVSTFQKLSEHKAIPFMNQLIWKEMYATRP